MIDEVFVSLIDLIPLSTQDGVSTDRKSSFMHREKGEQLGWFHEEDSCTIISAEQL